MSETKHTPGPWYWCDGEGEADLEYLTSQSGKICEFGNCHVYFPQCGELPNEANARLIAAAPELLEALDDLVSLAEVAITQANRDGAEYEVGEELSAARAAIAKAKGGSHED